MDEKRLLRDVLGTEPNRRTSPRHSRLWVALFTILGVAAFRTQWTPSRLTNPPSSFSYDGERIKWQHCGDIKGHPLECSSIDVPIDQFDTENSGYKTFNIPLIHMRGKNATQNLLLNPGGPGGSGIEYVYRRGEQLNTTIGEGFHLLSFDPRGVNSSEPMASCYPNDEARRELSRVTDNSSFTTAPRSTPSHKTLSEHAPIPWASTGSTSILPRQPPI